MNARRTSFRKRPQNEGGLFAPLEKPLWDDLLKHQPRKPDHFEPERIVLAAGSVVTPERAAFVERIIRLYPQAKIEHRPDLAHNKIPPESPGTFERHLAGKKTLVFGVHKSLSE